jgi:hypothetical protein
VEAQLDEELQALLDEKRKVRLAPDAAILLLLKAASCPLFCRSVKRPGDSKRS